MLDIEILYTDEHWVAINKPSGLAVHRGWADDDEYAMTRVRDMLGRWVYPVHRLDRGASGVLVFGLSSEAARYLCDAFERRLVAKRYLALVRGTPPSAELVIDHPLRPEKGGETAGKKAGEPQAALTRVRALAQYGRYAWVEARPETGRLHQIRRHLKHISCPLIGDVRYGKGEHNRLFRERYGLHRLALHASSLTLPREDGSELELLASLPPDLEGAIAQLASEQAPA